MTLHSCEGCGSDLPHTVAPVSIEQAVYRHMDELGVPYRVIHIDPAYADTTAFCQRYGFAPEVSVNCILVATKTGERRYAACLVQATKRLDVNHVVKRLIDARRVSFASAEDTVAVTGMTPGGVTPFGLPAELPIYVDAPVMDLDEIVLGGGGRSTKILISPAALAKLPSATVVEGLAS
jgi:prolyl-tRNA editing enzyme YbaK/EbsC (Cys-tRNA(Pro) deacylase)